ncbi:hypothetical protein ACWGR4_36490 [Embleya sp. NPDC055664]
MTPLILGRRAAPPARAAGPLPEHHYDDAVCANVVPDGRLLIHVVDARTIAAYTETQEPLGWKKDD